MFGTAAKDGAYTRLPYDDSSDDEDDFIKNQIRSQQKSMRRQDEHLDELGTAVDRLGHLSLKIGEEIEDQNRILTELDTDLDNTVDKLDMITRKTKELVKKSGGPKWFLAIIVLSAIFLVLLMLVLYT
mmetsp:Transcript_13452/g.17718  ORF Transcript_13452/g.17718 Transcript_13452/m.17718 type:complete len:128 (-) Transcript_13452:243-626(-)